MDSYLVVPLKQTDSAMPVPTLAYSELALCGTVISHGHHFSDPHTVEAGHTPSWLVVPQKADQSVI